MPGTPSLGCDVKSTRSMLSPDPKHPRLKKINRHSKIQSSIEFCFKSIELDDFDTLPKSIEKPRVKNQKQNQKQTTRKKTILLKRCVQPCGCKTRCMVVVLRAVQPIFFNCWGYPAHFQVAAQLLNPALALRLSSPCFSQQRLASVCFFCTTHCWIHYCHPQS